MRKLKRKLTPAQKREKARRKAEFMTVFVRGKQKRVRRPVLIDGLTQEEFIRRNADPIWLQQNEMWEELTELYEDTDFGADSPPTRTDASVLDLDDDIPF